MTDYSYAIKIHDGRSCLLIEDKSPAGNFITNNMENVVDEICHKEQINPADPSLFTRTARAFMTAGIISSRILCCCRWTAGRLQWNYISGNRFKNT